MNPFDSIRKSVPFLKHLSSREADFFFRSGRIITIKSGQYADLKKTSALNIVLSGIFEVETIGNAEVVYFSTGSFFGFLPFVENRKRGNVRALLDSTLFVIHEEELYKFFLRYHKALRGYIRMITSMGFDITDAGRKYFNLKGRVVSVFGLNEGSGKTLLSAMLGLSLSGDDTVLLDLSYTGNSLFDVLEQRLTAPVSEKTPDGEAESIINDRLVNVREGLYLLNLTFSSRVRIDSSIIGIVLFLLSRRFKYIIADISNSDAELRDAMLERSDMVFAMTCGKKETLELNSLFDEKIDDFQRIFYVRNDYSTSEKGMYVGGLTLEKIGGLGNSATMEPMDNYIKSKKLDPLISKIRKDEKALVVQSLALDSIILSRFFIDLQQSGKFFDCMYSSSISYLLLSLYMLGNDEKSLTESMRRFYSADFINKNMDISFPESFIFKSNRIKKYCNELAGGRRIEMFHTLPVCRVSSPRGDRIFSTGEFSGMMSASYFGNSCFEPVEIAGESYNSGYPNQSVTPAELFRTDFDEIFYLHATNRERISIDDIEGNELYLKSINPEVRALEDNTCYLGPGKNLHIELSENEFKFDKIIDKTKKLTQTIVSGFI